jgi:multisubunit Na+/H+ antiporter MnhB subunit
MKPPVSVVSAVALIALSFALGPLTVLASSPKFFTTAIGLLVALFSLVLSIAILRALYVGRNWVRWICVFLVATTVVYLPWSFHDSSALDLSQTALQAIATILLLLPASNGWYGPNKSFKPKPLRGSA